MSFHRFNKPLSRDTTAFGAHLSILSAEMVEILGLLGFDWLFLDAEHSPLNVSQCRDLVRVADLSGMSCLVRVPYIQSSVIESFLDVGVLGIMAPHVDSAADAEALVTAVKFAPQGQRGAASKTRAANYGLTGSPSDYFRAANHATFTVALVETLQGIEALEAIMSVPGVDYVAIGANDLGLSMGIQAGAADASVRAIVEASQARIRQFGKPQLAMVADADQAVAAQKAGARLIAIQDTLLLTQATLSFLSAAKR